MIRSALRTCMVAAIAWASVASHAAITCTCTSSGWSTAYVPTTTANNITQASISLTCQRNAAGDGASVAYTISANNGSHGAGQQNRAQIGASTNRINYDLYQDSGCNTNFGTGGARRITGTMTGLTNFTPETITVFFWGCVPGSQTGLAAGTYTDSVTLTPTPTTPTNPTCTSSVTIVSPASCTISTAPGNVAFTYSAFQATDALATTNFGVTCTNLLPYTMALDATTAVIAGLQYSVALSSSGGTGTGLEQTYSVNGDMPANQAGTCLTSSCATTQPRTLTITY
jgi:spore coat protein U-like protein